MVLISPIRATPTIKAKEPRVEGAMTTTPARAIMVLLNVVTVVSKDTWENIASAIQRQPTTKQGRIEPRIAMATRQPERGNPTRI